VQALPTLADAISYVVSDCSLLLIKGRFQEERVGDEMERASFLALVRAGLAWLQPHRLFHSLVAERISATTLLAALRDARYTVGNSGTAVRTQYPPPRRTHDGHHLSHYCRVTVQ